MMYSKSLVRKYGSYSITLALIVAMAAVLRMSQLSASLDYDETFASRTKLSFSPSGLAWMLYDTHPPFYNGLMLLWNHLFGEHEISLRAIPYVCSLLALVVAAAVARRIAGDSEALALAFLMALSGACAYFSHEARSYSLIVLLFLLMIYWLLRYERSANVSDLMWYVIFSVLCAVSHIYSTIFVLALAVTVAWRVARPWNIVPIARLLLLQMALLVPFYFTIVLMTLFTKEHAYLENFTDKLSAPEIAEMFSFFVFGYGGLNRYWIVHVLALALFAAGLTRMLLKNARIVDCKLKESSQHTFDAPALRHVFVTVVAGGLIISAALMLSPWFVRRDIFATLIPNQEHAPLMSQMVMLVSRTATLYFVGYSLVCVAWLLLGTSRVGAWMKALVDAGADKNLAASPWSSAVLVFPLLALIPIVLLSHQWPSYNARYMIAVLPIILLPMAVVLASVANVRIRVLLMFLLGMGQIYSVTQQDSLHKPDYRGAISYLYNSGRSAYPVACTAPWEAQGLGKYYSRQFNKPELQLIPIRDLTEVANVSVLVPELVPLELDRFADVRRIIQQSPDARRIDFRGITLYEINRQSR